MNNVQVYLSASFIIVALLYLSVMYLSFDVSHEYIVIIASAVFILTLYHLYKSKFKFTPISVGILLFIPLMIASLLIQ